MIWSERRAGTDSRGDRGGQTIPVPETQPILLGNSGFCKIKGSPERCRFRFFPFFFFPFSSVFSVFFDFFPFPFVLFFCCFFSGSECFPFLFCFLPLYFQKKKGEILFARPLLQNPEKLTFGSRLPVPFWSGEARTLNCILCPMVVTLWGSPGLRAIKT